MIEIRACRGFEELQACVDLEIETWGYDPTDLVPRKTFLLAQKVGGQVIGAFENREQGSEGARERKGREQGSEGARGRKGREQGSEGARERARPTASVNGRIPLG